MRAKNPCLVLLTEQSFYSQIPVDGKLSASFARQCSYDFLQSEEGCSSVPNGNEEHVLAVYRKMSKKRRPTEPIKHRPYSELHGIIRRNPSDTAFQLVPGRSTLFRQVPLKHTSQQWVLLLTRTKFSGHRRLNRIVRFSS